jgi:folate-binding protein YgfZ
MAQSFLQQLQGAVIETIGGVETAANYGDARAEYQAARETVAIHLRDYRGLIEIKGNDRAAWFHNLFTNEVKNLQSGEGNYGFALNIKGRVIFDGNIWVAGDALFLDVQRGWAGDAMTHLNKYIIMEDVELVDRSTDFARFALLGPRTGELASSWGLSNASAKAQLQHDAIHIADVEVRAIRHDFAGPLGIELIVPADRQPEVWQACLAHAESLGLKPAGWDAIEILRVEAGIPRSRAEIDGEILPAETRQIERGLSFNKGCYLGQEVVERMRSRGSIAKLLVGLVFDREGVQPAALLESEGRKVGRVTSAVKSIQLGQQIGLGYVETALAEPGTELTATTGTENFACRVSDLPFT